MKIGNIFNSIQTKLIKHDFNTSYKLSVAHMATKTANRMNGKRGGAERQNACHRAMRRAREIKSKNKSMTKLSLFKATHNAIEQASTRDNYLSWRTFCWCMIDPWCGHSYFILECLCVCLRESLLNKRENENSDCNCTSAVLGINEQK